jgi:hypothetical protein
VSFFPPAGRGGGPEPRVLQDPFHRVGADQRHPVVGFRQLIGKAFLAPIGMCAPQRQHLLGHRRRCAVGHFRSPTGEFGQPREALRFEARLPVVERPAAHMGCATGRGDMAGRLPGFKQQRALLCRSQWKVNVFGSHTTIIARFGDCSKCAGPLHYSSKTIAQLQRSRNQYHWEAFDQIKALLGDKPLVLDREFSYLELLEYLVQVSVNFVIRLNMGRHAPTFYDAAGRKVILTVDLGGQAVYHQLRYKGKVLVNVVGVWRKGCAEPLWVMSSLPPERALAIYFARMKIEEAFRDLKNLLNLDKVMNKSQAHMEQMAALVMLAFTIGFLSGEAVRDELYGAADAPQAATATGPSATETTQTNARRKWQLYSGLFIVLKRKISLSKKRLRQLQNQVVSAFADLIQPLPVRT